MRMSCNPPMNYVYIIGVPRGGERGEGEEGEARIGEKREMAYCRLCE